MNESCGIETVTKRNLNPVRLVIFVLILAYNLINYVRGIEYIGDTYWYWFAGDLFYKNGQFSILHYSGAPFRGYIIPLLTLGLRKVAQILGINAVLVYEILSALFFAYFISTLMPDIYELLTKKKRAKWYQIGMLFVIVSLFWRGYFIDLLSDFYAVAALLLALKYHVLAERTEKNSYFFWAGLFSGLSVLIRSNYKYSFYLIILYIFIGISFKNRLVFDQLGSYGRRLIIFLIGAMIICFPQFLINQRHGKFGFFPYDSKVKMVNTDRIQMVSLAQLQGGIGIEKCLPGIYYDRHGIDVMHKYYGYPPGNYTEEDFIRLWREHTMENFGEYLAMVVKYPLDFACIYFRHLFNGLDVRAHRYGPGKEIFYYAFVNYTILFVVLVFLYHHRKKTGLKFLILLGILFLPSVSIIPGMIEIRYFLSFHLFNYTTLCFSVDFRTLFPLERRSVIKYLVAYLIFMLSCFTFASSNLGHI
jgi:hypothetical protein